MGFFDSLLGPVGGGVAGLIGLFGAADDAERARRQREQALSDYSGWLDNQNNVALMNNLRGLYAGQGVANDNALQFARGLGDAMAQAGVWNSTGTSSATSQALNQGMAQAMGNYTNADVARQQMQNQGKMNLSQMRYGMANQDYQNAMGQQNNVMSGLASWLGTMAQNHLAQSGANVNRAAIPQVNGTVNQAQGLPGVAGNALPHFATPYNYGGYGHPYGMSQPLTSLFK